MKRMALLLLMAAPIALAQEPPPPDPFAEIFFPPELVMQNQQVLGLTSEQKTQLRAEVQKAQSHFTDLQWKMQDETQELTSLARETSPSEERILAQLDKVLALEREIKRTHLSLVIRMKRILTPDQQRQLHDLRKRGPAPPR